METNEENKQPGTSLKTTLGWICIVFGSMPVMIAISDKSKAALIIGGIMLISGFVLLIIGKKKETKSGQ